MPPRGPQNTGFTIVWGSSDAEKLAIQDIPKLGHITSVSTVSLNVPLTLGFSAGGYKYIVQSANHPQTKSFLVEGTEFAMENFFFIYLDKVLYRVYRSSNKINLDVKITLRVD